MIIPRSYISSSSNSLYHMHIKHTLVWKFSSTQLFLPKSFLTPVTSVSSFICDVMVFSRTSASWGRGDMQGVKSTERVEQTQANRGFTTKAKTIWEGSYTKNCRNVSQLMLIMCLKYYILLTNRSVIRNLLQLLHYIYIQQLK